LAEPPEGLHWAHDRLAACLLVPHLQALRDRQAGQSKCRLEGLKVRRHA